MTEQHAQGGAGEPVPPSETAPDRHADPAPARDGGHAARAPLGEWRAPAFWMACGALLAGMVGGAVALVERVGVERDMMAVAATLPQATPSGPARVQPPAAIPPEATPAPSLALRPSASLSTSPANPARRHLARRPPAAMAKAHAKAVAEARRKRAVVQARYAEVFKRCPPPGARGAAQCRRDICNGAEGRGPACKPYVRKLP